MQAQTSLLRTSKLQLKGACRVGTLRPQAAAAAELETQPPCLVKFHESSINAFSIAHQAARQQGASVVDEAHLLHALLATAKNSTQQLLSKAGVTVSTLGVDAGKLVANASARSSAVPSFSPRVQQLIQRSAEQARRRGQSEIATEHLVHSLLHNGAAQLHGADALQASRPFATAPQASDQVASPARQEGKLSNAAFKALFRASLVCGRLGHSYITTLHILLGLVAQASGPLGSIFAAAGTDYATAERAVASIIGGPADVADCVPGATDCTVWCAAFTTRAERALQLAQQQAVRRSCGEASSSAASNSSSSSSNSGVSIGSGDLMLGLLLEADESLDAWTVRAMETLGVDPQQTFSRLLEADASAAAEGPCTIRGYMQEEFFTAVAEILQA